MRGYSRIAILAGLWFLLVGGVLFALFHRPEVTRKKHSARVAPTDVVLPMDEHKVAARIAALSHGVLGRDYSLDLPGRFANFYLESSGEFNSPFKDDFLLSPPADFYWPSSEYVYHGKPAQFSTSFIIHLEALPNNQTRIEVIESSPIVKAGRLFGWSAHTGPFPQFFDNIRPVPPGVEDGQEVLAVLERALMSTKPSM